MSVLCPAQVTSRANSQLLIIESVAGDTTLSTPARMELIYWQIAEWNTAVAGSTGAAAGKREAEQRARRPGMSHLR